MVMVISSSQYQLILSRSGCENMPAVKKLLSDSSIPLRTFLQYIYSDSIRHL